jgi:hypothetical protein
VNGSSPVNTHLVRSLNARALYYTNNVLRGRGRVSLLTARTLQPRTQQLHVVLHVVFLIVSRKLQFNFYWLQVAYISSDKDELLLRWKGTGIKSVQSLQLTDIKEVQALIVLQSRRARRWHTDPDCEPLIEVQYKCI